MEPMTPDQKTEIIREERFEIVIVGKRDRDLHELIGRLDEELLERYPADEIFGLDFDSPKADETTFAVAYLGSRPVACGAFRPLEEPYAEIKRFFVERDSRKLGIASRMLAYLERKAAEAGHAVMRLETGEAQPEAVGLYSKFGYEVIPAYGEYAGCESSLCMEKKLNNR